MGGIRTLTIGEIQTGAYKRGLKPQIFRENRGEILPGKSGLFGADWSLFRACRGLFGADRDQFLRTPHPRGKSRNCPERALFGPIGAFRAKPPFAKPPPDFPETSFPPFCWKLLHVWCNPTEHQNLKDSEVPRQIVYTAVSQSTSLLAQIPWIKTTLLGITVSKVQACSGFIK